MNHQQHEQQQQQEPAKTACKATWQAIAREQLAGYGYELAGADEAGHFRIFRPGKPHSCVAVKFKNKCFQTYGIEAGTLLWSGPDIGRFLKDFWFAERVTKTH